MRQTLSDLITICQNGAGQDTSATSKTFFIQAINRRDNLMLSKLPSYLSEITKTFSTVADQQYYHYPPNFRRVESLTVTVGSVDYVLDPVTSQVEWDGLNAITIQSGAVPRYYFNRQREFGIWPIPQDAYTGTVVYNTRGGNMTFEDYTTGTVTVTENDATVTGAGGADWSSSGGNIKADYWFVLADSNGEPRGNWYRIGSVTDGTNLELETVFEETTESGASYIIGQTSEAPEEGHELIAYGAIADYFSSFRQSLPKAQTWENKFWTGDFTTSKNQARNDPDTMGGFLGLINDYRDRNDTQLVRRGKNDFDASLKVWATDIS